MDEQLNNPPALQQENDNTPAVQKTALPEVKNEGLFNAHEKAIIDKWAARMEAERVSFRYVEMPKKEGEEDSKIKNIIQEFRFNNLSDQQKYILTSAVNCAATGSAGDNYSILLFTDTLNGVCPMKPGDISGRASAVIEALLALAPKEPIEGMLCSNLVALESAIATRLNVIAQPEATIAGSERAVNQLTKLMRVRNETIDVLDKHRRNGEQKVTVQHVHVGDGGQAVVAGQVNQGGRGQ